MCGGSRRPCLQGQKLLGSFEDGIEVESITMNQTGCLYSVLEKEVDFLKLLEGASSFKVEYQTIWCLRKALARVICVYYWLAELFLKCLLLQDCHIDPMKVLIVPKSTLSNLFIV